MSHAERSTEKVGKVEQPVFVDEGATIVADKLELIAKESAEGFKFDQTNGTAGYEGAP